MYNNLSLLYDDFKIFIEKLNIFHNIDEIYNNKENTIQTMLININRKNTLAGIPNILFSNKAQYNNISGFNTAYNKAGQIHSPFKSPKDPNTFITLYDKINKYDTLDIIKQNWHYDMMMVLFNVFYKAKYKGSKKPNIFVTLLNEEWHKFNVNSENDEFVTLKHNGTPIINKIKKTSHKIEFLGNVVKPITSRGQKCNIKEMLHLIKHRLFYIGNDIIVINIHSASNMNSKDTSDEIIKLLNKIRKSKKFNTFKIILGGDSNIYYGKITTNNNGVSDIIYFKDLLKKIGYNLIISKNIVAKYRPYNYFQNAQSATKGGDWTNEETMIIAYPNNLNVAFDTKYYIQVEDLKITDFYKNYRYGFLGTRYKKLNRSQHIKSINYNNWYDNLYSDHIPIFCDINVNGNVIRLLFSNNLSINSSRGINNNTSKFIVKDVKKLEEFSKKQIADFFIKKIKLLLKQHAKKVTYSNNKLVYLKQLLDYKLPLNKKGGGKKTNDTLFNKLWDNDDNCINYKQIIKNRRTNKINKVKKSIIKKFKPIILSLKKGALKKYGYKDIKTLGVRKRRQSLAKAINDYGAKKVFRKLGVVKTLHKNKNVELSKKYFNNMVWLRKKFDKEFKGSYKKSALFKK